MIDAVGDDRVQPGRRFVVKDNLRLVNDRAGQADSFAHASGQFRGLLVLGPAQVHHFQRLIHLSGDFAFR